MSRVFALGRRISSPMSISARARISPISPLSRAAFHAVDCRSFYGHVIAGRAHKMASDEALKANLALRPPSFRSYAVEAEKTAQAEDQPTIPPTPSSPPLEQPTVTPTPSSPPPVPPEEKIIYAMEKVRQMIASTSRELKMIISLAETKIANDRAGRRRAVVVAVFEFVGWFIMAVIAFLFVVLAAMHLCATRSKSD